MGDAKRNTKQYKLRPQDSLPRAPFFNGSVRSHEWGQEVCLTSRRVFLASMVLEERLPPAGASFILMPAHKESPNRVGPSPLGEGSFASPLLNGS